MRACSVVGISTLIVCETVSVSTWIRLSEAHPHSQAPSCISHSIASVRHRSSRRDLHEHPRRVHAIAKISGPADDRGESASRSSMSAISQQSPHAVIHCRRQCCMSIICVHPIHFPLWNQHRRVPSEIKTQAHLCNLLNSIVMIKCVRDSDVWISWNLGYGCRSGEDKRGCACMLVRLCTFERG